MDGLLAFVCRIWCATRAHSQDMISRNFFIHANLEEKDPCTRTNEKGGSNDLRGEHSSRSKYSPQAALDAFKKFPEPLSQYDEPSS